jgi:hypothetical protein
MKFWGLTLCLFHLINARFIIYHYNTTYNAVANEFAFKMDTGNRRGLNFSYEIDVWNKVEMISESSEFI